jgi:hypothetical protein
VAPDFACEVVGAAPRPITRLREALPDGFLVLLAGMDGHSAAGAAVRASRIAYPAPVGVAAVGLNRPLRDVTVLRAVDPGALRPYVAAGPRAWVIRPDGHIAASVALDTPDAVDRLPVLVASAMCGSARAVPDGQARPGGRSLRPRRAGVGSGGD